MKTKSPTTVTPPECVFENLSPKELGPFIEAALRGDKYIPRDRDDSPAFAVFNHSKLLSPEKSTAFTETACRLLEHCNFSRPKADSYVQELIRLITELKATQAIPTLRKMARATKKSRNRYSWETISAILFGILNLGGEESDAFWSTIARKNLEVLAPAWISAALENDPFAGIHILKELPDIEHLGDVAAINLDYQADQLSKSKRKKFLKEVETICKDCKKKIAKSVNEWLQEYQEPLKPSNRRKEKPQPEKTMGTTPKKKTASSEERGQHPLTGKLVYLMATVSNKYFIVEKVSGEMAHLTKLEWSQDMVKEPNCMRRTQETLKRKIKNGRIYCSKQGTFEEVDPKRGIKVLA